MPPDASNPESWEVALARLRGQDRHDAGAIDHDAGAIDHDAVDRHRPLDRRVRDVETGMATMRQQLAEIDSQKPAKTNWTAVASTIAACLAVGLVIADRLFK